MNQILVTEKLYVTPELKKKKKMYKFNLIISIILVVVLFSICVYAEYDRNKNADISQDILAQMNTSNDIEYAKANNVTTDNTTIHSDTLVIALDGDIVSSDNTDTNTNTYESNQDDNIDESSFTTEITIDGKKYSTVGSISIPKINVNYPILSETSPSLLKVSVCKFWGSYPNQVGNLCIAGHNYRNKRFFSKVLNLVVGDIIEITDLNQNTLQYSVYDKYTVDEDNVSCTSQLTNGEKIVTLITCTNDSKQRVIVQAREI